MSDKKRVLYVFHLLDYQAMAEYFEEQAAQGWMLEKIGYSTIDFYKTEPRKGTFAVDIFPYVSAFDSYNSQAVKEYRELAETSGWTFITSSIKLQVFYTENPAQAIPLQTDPEEERQILKKAFFSLEVLLMFVLFPILLSSIGLLFSFPYDKLYLNSTVVSTILSPVLLVPITLYVVYYVHWFWKANQNIKKGLLIPKTSVQSALFRGKFLLFISATVLVIYLIAAITDAINGSPFQLYFLLIPLAGTTVGIWFRKKRLLQNKSRGQNIFLFIAMSLGIGLIFSLPLLNAGQFSGASLLGIQSEIPEGYSVMTLSNYGLTEKPTTKSFSRKSSIAVPESYEYHEISPEGTVRTYYYQAANEELAAYMFNGMLEQEGSLLYRTVSEASENEWGVDEAYYLKADKSMVLLLKGQIVMMLDNSLSFSSNRKIEITKEQLNN